MHTPDALRSTARRQLVAAIHQQHLLLSLPPEILSAPDTSAARPKRKSCPSAPRSTKNVLHLLCAVEALAGFALHALSALLVLFLCERNGYSQSHAIHLVGIINALCYLGPLLGGWLADRILGFRWAVLAGAMAMCVGFAILARAPSELLPSVVFIVLGAALFRSNVVVLAGRLNHAGGMKREAAYRRLYVAFNLGAATAPPVVALLHLTHGWAAPFALCALAMAGVVVLMASAYGPLSAADQPDFEPQQENPSDPDSPFTTDGISRRRLMLLMLMITALWAACIGQSDGSLLLWARDHAHRRLLGHEVPPAAFASLPPLLALLLSPLVDVLKRWRFARSTSSRLTVGMGSTSLAMVLMTLAALLAKDSPSNVAWLLGCFVLLIIGELLVVPLTQSVLSNFAPRRRHGVVLAASYGAIAVGHAVAGAGGTLWLRWPKPAYFALFACVASSGVLMLMLYDRKLRSV